MIERPTVCVYSSSRSFFAMSSRWSVRHRGSSAHVAYGSWPRENAEIEFANGNFVSTSVNLKNKSAGDGCRDKTIEKTI
ncbi:hypothetical protein, partial [Bradyrhizobium sp.]|uniref:hypothetical protein n=1 Tax=Bradyrhizobium sp. TaxID=376 RepID=UPI003BB14E33